jgi:hypothetical protein
MRVAQNTEVLSYLVEAKVALRTELYLACILISGALAELVLREISSDFKNNISAICKRLYENKILNEEQYDNFTQIRKIRNQYAHINLKRNWDKPPEGIIFERNGNAAFLEEVLERQRSLENKIFMKHYAYSALDAEKIYKLISSTLLKLDIDEDNSNY